MIESTPVANDLLEGAEAIAAELGWSRRRVYYAVEQGSGWPIWREGGVITSTRSALRSYLFARAQEAMTKEPRSEMNGRNGKRSQASVEPPGRN